MELEKDSLASDRKEKKQKRVKKDAKWKSSSEYVMDPEAYKNIKETKKKSIFKVKKPQYPTKNFLQNFKSAHHDFLKSRVAPEILGRYQVVERLTSKIGMNMKAYCELYSIEDFEAIFKEMFASKFLYRAMMLSRS